MNSRWLGVLALLILIIIAYADRVNISVMLVNEDFLNTFHLVGNRALQGGLMTVFLIGYGLSAFFITPLFESQWGYRKGLFLSVVLWAVFTMMSPLAGSLFILFIFRILLGISEGPLFSLKTMYIRDHFAANELGKPNAISSLGVSLGLVLGFPIVTYLMSTYGWQQSFYILGLLNLVIGLTIIYFFIDVPKRETVSIQDNADLGFWTSTVNTFKLAWKTPLLGWIILVEIATLSYLWGSSSWLPSYLTKEHNFSLKEMGFISSLPFIVSIISKYAGGAFLDKMSKNHAALAFVVGGFFTAITMGIVVFAENNYVIAASLLAANAFWGFQGAAIPTIIQHQADPKSVGSAYGVINGIGNTFAAFIPFIMGVVIQQYSSISSGFFVLIISQVLTCIAGLGLWLRMRSGQPILRFW